MNKVKSCYMNYSEKNRNHYFTLYFSNGEKVYVPYEMIKVAENTYDKKKQVEKKDK